MGRPETAVIEVTLADCFCATELAGLEHELSRFPGVLGARVDRTRSVAHLRYNPARTDVETLRTQVHRLGYRCECAPAPDSCCQPGHPPVGAADARNTAHRPSSADDGHAESAVSAGPAGPAAPPVHDGHAHPAAADRAAAPPAGTGGVAGHAAHEMPSGAEMPGLRS